jgi:hypothetical protein
MRTLVPAGAVVALGGAVALALTLAATVASAPSALAAAVAKTSAMSFRFTSTLTQVTSPASDDNGPPVRVTGVFDPARGLGEEEAGYSMTHIRIVDGNIYVELAGSRFARAGRRYSQGKLWVESPTSAASVQAEGPASGPGWTGTKYVFTERLKYAYPGETVSGAVYVDTSLTHTRARAAWPRMSAGAPMLAS